MLPRRIPSSLSPAFNSRSRTTCISPSTTTMPKEPAVRKRTVRENPISKPEEPAAAAKPSSKKYGRDSHLYTDDNPKTTIHGTGFKDEEAAKRTLKLIENRSLIYQFQTVNTMYNRAKHHPSMKKAASASSSTQNIQSAMSIFRTWLDTTYPTLQTSLRAQGFKPLLSKSVVNIYLSQIQAASATTSSSPPPNKNSNSKTQSDNNNNNNKHMNSTFAEIYTNLPKGKKLGNVLVDESQPGEADWEIRRYQALDRIVPEGMEMEEEEKEEEEEEKEKGRSWKELLWDEEGKVSEWHLSMIAWAWSPVSERKLVAAAAASK